MTNQTITDYSALASPANDDEVLAWDTSVGATKKITFANFTAALGATTILRDGSVTLTGDWDIGNARYIAGDKFRARGVAGLRLEDDAGVLGIYVEDATGNVGLGTTTLTGAPRLTIAGGIRASYDADMTSYFGRAAVGYDGTTTDEASFAHIDMNSGINAALRQTNLGTTTLSAASGKTIRMAVAGSAIAIIDGGDFYPGTDNAYGCGKSGARWQDVWAGNGTIQTSDVREKEEVAVSDLGLSFIRALAPIRWRFRDHVRPHYGLSAQQVKAALDELGVADFAGYIHDPETDVYALRYSEFIGPIVAALQEIAARLERLEKQYGH